MQFVKFTALAALVASLLAPSFSQAATPGAGRFSASKLQQQFSVLDRQNPGLVNHVYNLTQNFLNEYTNSTLTLTELKVFLNAYFGGFNKRFYVEDKSYSSASVKSYIDLVETCVALYEKEKKRDSTCQAITFGMFLASFNPDIAQTYAAKGLATRLSYEKKQGKKLTSQETAALDLLSNGLSKVKTDFKVKEQESWNDFNNKSWSVQDFLKRYKITLVKD